MPVKRISCYAVAIILDQQKRYLLTESGEGLMPICTPIGTGRQQAARILHDYDGSEPDNALSFTIQDQASLPHFADWFMTRKGRDTSMKPFLVRYLRNNTHSLENVSAKETFRGFNALTFQPGGAHSFLTMHLFDVFVFDLGSMTNRLARLVQAKSPWYFATANEITHLYTFDNRHINRLAGALLKPRQKLDIGIPS